MAAVTVNEQIYNINCGKCNTEQSIYVYFLSRSLDIFD